MTPSPGHDHPDLPENPSGADPAGAAVPTGPSPRRGRRAVGLALSVVAVLTVCFNLRPGAVTVGPLLDQISATFGMGETFGGILTALPGFCFGVLGLLAVPIAKRAGLTGTVVLSFALVAIGLLLRPLAPSAWVFFLLTMLGLAGPAVGNVLIPAWVKRHGGDRTVLLMTMYSILLAAGGALSTLVVVPLADASGGGWRTALGIWGLAAAVPVVVWAVVWRRTGHDFPPVPGAAQLPGSLLRSPTAIALTITFGLQSMNAYIQIGWAPRILIDAGLSPASAGALQAVVGGCGMLGGLLMPWIIARTLRTPVIVLSLGVITAAGYVGLLVAPGTAPLVWMLLLGIGGFIFPATIALLPARTRDHRVTARLSGMVQPVGYSLAAVGPFLVGIVHEALGGWTLILAVLVVLSLLMGVTGWRAAAHTMVDDELAA